ncbi:hypothetical protein ACQ4LE_004092 [Meloidogyne hapla]|uniref:Carbonic anhydrase n=1 Tax=Meloidogyne hapla TaxID=6305 RepID=A0A1I8B2V6_MELHA
MYFLPILILFPILLNLNFILGADWKYPDSTWGSHYPVCKNGKKQSPIDIRRVSTVCVPKLSVVNYIRKGDVEVKNNGHGVEVEGFENWRSRPYIEHGGLNRKYFLAQFHFHWAKDLYGSEHKLNGYQYAAEVHFVHVREGLSFEQAKNTPNGLAVLAVFMVFGRNDYAMKNLERALLKVVNEGSKETIKDFQIVFGFGIPTKVDSFLRYEGSLTTPGCNEVVQWFILPNSRFDIGRVQLGLLRSIKGSAMPQGNNVRSIQQLNGRTVINRSLQNCNL